MNSPTMISSSLERLLESVGVGIWRYYGATGQFSMDETCRQIIDLSPGEEPSYEYLASLLDEQDLQRYRKALTECLETGSFNIEYQICCRDGQYRFISGRGHAMPAMPGEPPIIKGVFIDITQNKELENRLRTTKSQMEQLADEIPGLFSYIDRDFKVQFMNSRYREIIHASTRTVIGEHIEDLIGHETFRLRRAKYEQALSGRTAVFEANIEMPDGSFRFFTIRHQPHKAENGETIGVMTLAMDITARRAAEKALENQSNELERSNRDLEQFAYVASHDLKAPLRSIEVLIEWLREDLDNHQKGEVQENLKHLQERTDRLDRLLDDLLAYSRAGRRIGDVKRTDTRLMVQDIANLLAPLAGMTIEAHDSLPTFEAHHAPLEQVLRNLISNAIQHHPTGHGHITIYAQDQGDAYMFAVEDDGAGIPEEYAEKIFQMFQTVQPRDEREGSGIGLAIAQRIIESQGGRIWFHPGPDERGAVFKFIWNKHPRNCGTDDETEYEHGTSRSESQQHLAG